MADTDNPYTAPSARVADVSPEASARSRFVPRGRSVPANRATDWIAWGWRSFKRNPGTWVAIFMIYLLVQLMLEVLDRLIPLVGVLLRPMLQTPLQGGVMLGCAAQDRDEPLRVSHLFAGFGDKFGPLIRVGFLLLLPALLAAMLVVFALLAWTGMPPQAGSDGRALGLFPLIVMGLAIIPATIVILMAALFAPALVVFNDFTPLEAVKSSFFACWRNIRGILLYAVLGLGLTLLGLIPLGLGLTVVGPVLTASIYAAYREIFFSPEPS